MPKFNITASFSLTTEIEVDLGYRAFDYSEVENFENESYFSVQPVEADGGSLVFTVEAEDEENAEEKAQEIISEGMEIADSDDLTWLVTDVSFDIEPVEEPMDVTRAKELVTKFIEDYPSMNPELKEAFLFLLRLITAIHEVPALPVTYAAPGARS